MRSRKRGRTGGRLRLETEATQQLKPTSQLKIEEIQLKERFDRLRQTRKIQQAKQVIKNLYGKHNPIEYKPEYHFQQSWEIIGASRDDNRNFTSWKNSSKIFNILQLLFIILYVVSLWFLSIYRIFQVENINSYILAGTIITQTVDVILEEMADSKEGKRNVKQILQKNILSFLLVFYLCFVLVETNILEKMILELIPVDLFFVVKIYRRLKKLYVLLKIKIPSYWRNQIQIAQLVGGCLILVHIFSIVLYVASQSDGSTNWTIGIATFNNCWGNRYIFSLYFACTTMFTVGYGDITPQNPWEILAVLMVQVVGIINMGYVINEVGRYLSKINEGEELLYRGISDAEKLSENYNLPSQLSQKLTSYVVNNQIANSRFNVEEENQFLDKLSEQVRQDVTGYSNFQLIKTSIFFLCHWTKRFQTTIADKLIRQVYSPEQVLPQVHGKEKLYILSRGKVDVQANFFSRQRPLSRKRLATIEIKPDKEVHFNTYGYTALISGHKLNLCAVARDYSICYYVDKESFVSAVEQNFTDFEYFHQIKSKIEESHCRQSFQAPKINNTKEHYQPNVYFIVKRNNKQNNDRQKRINLIRQKKKDRLILYSQNFSTKEIENLDKKKRRVSIDQVNLEVIEETDKNYQFSSVKSFVNILSREQINDEEKRKNLFFEQFESSKNFGFFRKKFNLDSIIKKYNTKFCRDIEVEEAFANFIFKTSGKSSDKISQQVLLKLLNSRIKNKQN